MSVLATTLLLAQIAATEPAPALQPLWEQFSRLKIPAASGGEETTALEQVLTALRAREERCVERFSQAETLKARQAELAAALERSGADLAPAELAARVGSCGAGVSVTFPGEAVRGAPVAVRLSGPGVKQGLPAAVVCVANLLSTLRLASFEVSREGWRADGTITLLAADLGAEPLPDAPPAAGRVSRRAGELRLRIAAARPGVAACEERLAGLGVGGLDTVGARVEKAEEYRATGTLLRSVLPLLFAAGAPPAVPATRIAAEEKAGRAEVSIAPYKAGVELRRSLRAPGSPVRVVSEQVEPGRLLLDVERPASLQSLLAAPARPEDPALATLVSLVRAATSPAEESLRRSEAGLQASSVALSEAAGSFATLLDDARRLDARRARALEALEAQGVALEPKAAAERVARCGAELVAPPSKVGARVALELRGRKESDGPHPWACVRKALRSAELVRFEQSVKSWKISATIELAAPDAATPPTLALPAVPAVPPEVRLNASPAVKAWRAALVELQSFLVSQRAGLERAGFDAVAALEARHDAAGRAESAGAVAALEEAVFGGDDAVRPPWMDLTVRGSQVDLNLSPRETGEALLGALRAAGCGEARRKVAGDSLRVSVACTR